MSETNWPAILSVPSPDTLARYAQRAHYLDLIQIYTGLGDEEIDLILMHLPRVASDRERTGTDSLARKGLIE